ncbi:NAD(P)H-binding protein [Kribbella sp. VKM Ac-2566]|uniref:NAD(P)H-binding protein n=1 Tax=Kribbella sp. VKM Ac-2566 TaxID=2512218 RepID=UPI00106364C7|nr:NAD(P)H-binding protein [Kribbella sp. VKM Ac-2566]TDW91542.1 uncharacterized protein YbjT (DUF2867 family) [Kribbella sp. VKM Ac-2566]
MILITGATGTVGSELSRQLIARGIPVRRMTRKALPDFVQGDFADPVWLRKAIDGADTVFLLSAPGPRVLDHDRALVAVAIDAGVHRTVKLSAIGSTDEGMPGNWHAAGERAVRDSGLAWTILRPTGFASNVLRWLPAVRTGQPIPNQTGDGQHAFIDPADVAAVAAEVLVSGAHDGRVYTLTGPALLSVPDQVAVMSDVLGLALRVVDVPLEVYAEQLRAADLDETVVSAALGGAALTRSGGERTLTNDVEQVLGRPARTFWQWIETHRTLFSST